jgi:hypothetical protein
MSINTCTVSLFEAHGAMENNFVNREITVGNKVVVAKQRKSDGWFDATAMCKAWKKDWHEYHRNKKTHDFLNCLKVRHDRICGLARGKPTNWGLDRVHDLHLEVMPGYLANRQVPSGSTFKARAFTDKLGSSQSLHRQIGVKPES